MVNGQGYGETVPVYELKKYNVDDFHIGHFVRKHSDSGHNRAEDDFVDPAWIGHITGYINGDIEVSWVDGTVSTVGHQNIYCIDTDYLRYFDPIATDEELASGATEAGNDFPLFDPFADDDLTSGQIEASDKDDDGVDTGDGIQDKYCIRKVNDDSDEREVSDSIVNEDSVVANALFSRFYASTDPPSDNYHFGKSCSREGDRKWLKKVPTRLGDPYEWFTWRDLCKSLRKPYGSYEGGHYWLICVLKWGGGYYNGDIKTRKTFQTMELKADKMGLQRSEQLKELYESLLDGESESDNELQTKKPSPGLSPEDLSDTEWYYLVCMSFVFNHGQGLPGRALANNQTIWLCDAQFADSKIFSRSLLAKTIVCFPYLGGVIELGVTDLVSEDHSLVQHIKTSLLKFSKPVCLDKFFLAHDDDENDADPIGTIVGHERDKVDGTFPFENKYIETEDMQELQGNNIIHDDDFDMASPDDSSNGSEHFHQTDDSFMLEGLNCGASQAQSWHFMDDDFSNGIQGSINSSDCISQVIVNHEKSTNNTSSKRVDVNKNCHLNELRKFNDTKFSSLDLGTNDDDLHYKRIISTVLGNSHELSGQLLQQGRNMKSGFVSWKRTERSCVPSTRSQQGILKKNLLSVPMMYGAWSKNKNGDKGWIWNEECVDPVLLDTSKENEKFMVLRSMVPSISKIDAAKAAILHDTIKYVQQLEAKS